MIGCCINIICYYVKYDLFFWGDILMFSLFRGRMLWGLMFCLFNICFVTGKNQDVVWLVPIDLDPIRIEVNYFNVTN